MSASWGSAAAVALIALVPLVVLMLTSFVKISVVLSLLRNAIGSPDAPSSLVVTGLSLLLTLFVMAPVGIEMLHAARTPASAAPGTPAPPAGSASPAPGPSSPPQSPGAPASPGPSSPAAPAPLPGPVAASPAAPDGSATDGKRRDFEGELRAVVPPQYQTDVDAAGRALEPLRAFLARHANARDRETFAQLATQRGTAVRGDEIWVLAPAFVTTELREAFAMAVLIFVPFLVIDFVVGLGLAALGLSSTQPQQVALPLKLLLFVAVDGWRLLIDSLLRGYA